MRRPTRDRPGPIAAHVIAQPLLRREEVQVVVGVEVSGSGEFSTSVATAAEPSPGGQVRDRPVQDGRARPRLGDLHPHPAC